MALDKWRVEAKRISGLHALSTVWRWREGTRQRLKLWRRWRSFVRADDEQLMPVASHADDEQVQRRRRAIRLDDWSRVEMPRMHNKHRMLRRWHSHAQIRRGTLAITAAALPILLSRYLRRWMQQAANKRGIEVAYGRALLRLVPGQRWALSRWRRYVLPFRCMALMSVCLERRRERDAVRVWRRHRRVQMALRQRRSANETRWALCRAWGRWRLRAVLIALG